MSNNPVMTDPSTGAEGVQVHNHATNAANDAHPGQLASGTHYPNNATAGQSTTNTSSGLKGSGVTGEPVDLSAGAQKTPRKTDGPAHTTQAASALHGDSARHGDDA